MIEIKSTAQIRKEDNASLGRFERDFPDAAFFVLSQDKISQRVGNIRMLPWEKGLEII